MFEVPQIRVVVTDDIQFAVERRDKILDRWEEMEVFPRQDLAYLFARRLQDDYLEIQYEITLLMQLMLNKIKSSQKGPRC